MEGLGSGGRYLLPPLWFSMSWATQSPGDILQYVKLQGAKTRERQGVLGARALSLECVWRNVHHPYLESHGVGGSQKYSQRQLGLVGPVAPQAMGTSCHTQSSQEEAEVGCKAQAGRMSAGGTELLYTPMLFFSWTGTHVQWCQGKNLRYEEWITGKRRRFIDL